MTLQAVIPVRSLAQAKQRLRGCLGPADRRTLTALMLEDEFDALFRVSALSGIVVVTADAETAALAVHAGAAVLDEVPGAGLNGAVAQAARRLGEQGVEGMLVLPCDVPGVSADELDALVQVHRGRRAMTLVPARDRDGTNALLLTPPSALQPAYGSGSCARHLVAGHAAGLQPRVIELPGLALDLDHPRDLHAFVDRYPGTRTGRFLRERLGADGISCRVLGEPGAARGVAARPTRIAGSLRRHIARTCAP